MGEKKLKGIKIKNTVPADYIVNEKTVFNTVQHPFGFSTLVILNFIKKNNENKRYGVKTFNRLNLQQQQIRKTST